MSEIHKCQRNSHFFCFMEVIKHAYYEQVMIGETGTSGTPRFNGDLFLTCFELLVL